MRAGLGDFDWSSFASTLANDAAQVAKVAVQPTTSINSSVSPSGVQTYNYSAPGYGTTTGVASLTGGSSWIWIALGALGVGLVVLQARR